MYVPNFVKKKWWRYNKQLYILANNSVTARDRIRILALSPNNTLIKNTAAHLK